MPAVILTSEFSVPSGRSFTKYIDYMHRQEALLQKKADDLLTRRERQELDRVTVAAERLELNQGRNVFSEPGEGNADDPKAREAQAILHAARDDGFSGYINYMTRQAALDRQTGAALPGAFAMDMERVTRDDLDRIKAKYETAQQRGSVLYEDVISFDTDFLIREKLYDSERNELNEQRLREAGREMMEKLVEQEGLMSPYWTATIHRNTEHVHIHFSVVELQPSRPMVEYERDGVRTVEPRGKRKQETIDGMKRAFANTLVDRTAQLSRISDLRNDLYREIKELYQDSWIDQARLVREILHELPENRKDWAYDGRNMPQSAREKIDRLTGALMKDSPGYAEYVHAVRREGEYRRELFGDTTDARKDYAANRLDDLHKRLGNALLKELKQEGGDLDGFVPPRYSPSPDDGAPTREGAHSHQQDRTVHAEPRNRAPDRQDAGSAAPISARQAKQIRSGKRKIFDLKRALRDDYDKWKAERDYERVEQRIAYAQEHGA